MKTKLEVLCAAVKELDEKATPGPWKWYEHRDVATLNGPLEDHKVEFASIDNSLVLDDGSAGGEYAPVIAPEEPNAQLIAHYRTAAPKLAMACGVMMLALQKFPEIAKNFGYTVSCDKEYQPWAQEANLWLRSQNMEISKQIKIEVAAAIAEVEKILEEK